MKTTRVALPLWLVAVAAVPFAAVFAFSLALAAVVLVGAGVVGALLLPLFLKRPPRRDDGTIELDPSQYRRLPRRGDD
jgi:hypothetical protein